MAANLPHDLKLEILSRLPAKSLLRFSCVSKHWYNWIHDPNFIKMHLNRSIEADRMNLFLATAPHPTMRSSFYLDMRMHCLEGDSFDKSFEIETPVEFEFREVLGSCNGLVCLSSRNLVCLLNPCTREYKTVKFDEEFSFTSKYDYGLGFDPAIEDYMLVQIVYSGEFDDMLNYNFDSDIVFKSEVNVYSLSDTPCPTTTISSIPYRIRNAHITGIYLNGYLHWLAETKPSSASKIISFDNREKVFREMPRPGNLGSGACMALGLLGGRLCIFCDFYDGDNELWVMKNYGVTDSWIKLFSLEKTVLQYRAPSSRVLCFAENGKILLNDGYKLVIYDPIRKKLWSLRYRGIRWERIGHKLIHVASLVPLKSDTYAGSVAIAGVTSSKKRKKRVWL